MTPRGRKRPLSSVLRDKLALMSPEDPKYFDMLKWIIKAKAQEIAELKERRKLREGKKPKVSKTSKTNGVIPGKMNPGAARYLEEQEKKNSPTDPRG